MPQPGLRAGVQGRSPTQHAPPRAQPPPSLAGPDGVDEEARSEPRSPRESSAEVPTAHLACALLLGAVASFGALHIARSRRAGPGRPAPADPAASAPLRHSSRAARAPPRRPAAEENSDEGEEVAATGPAAPPQRAPQPPEEGAAGRRISKTAALRPLSPAEDPFGAGSARARPPGRPGAPPRPNVILLLADDLGWADVGRYFLISDDPNGPGVAKPPATPALDQMIGEGTAFTSFYVSSPVCSASRATFMTGQWPTSQKIKLPYIYTNNHDSNAEKGQSDFLNKAVPTLPQLLRRAGYATAHFGKWHLGGTPDAPAVSDYGYQTSATFASNPKTARADSAMLWRVNPPFQDISFPGMSSTVIIDKVLDFMERNAESSDPFYVNAWFHVAHAPLNPSRRQLEPFPKSVYCPASGMFPNLYSREFSTCPIQVYHAALADLDQQIGRLMQGLRVHKNRRIRNNTLVLYTSDNGPEDEQVYFNAKGQTGPFRGRKRSLYEGGIRVPAVAWWPGRVPSGRYTGADFTAFDWLPTVAALAGVELPESLLGRCDESACLAGRDASPLLLAEAAQVPRHLPLVWDYRFRILGPCLSHSPRLAVREGHLKLLVHSDLTRIELYNTTQDPMELSNIAAGYPADVERLSRVVLSWMRTQWPTARNKIELNRGCRLNTYRFVSLSRADDQRFRRGSRRLRPA